jgi:hypothetical protein
MNSMINAQVDSNVETLDPFYLDKTSISVQIMFDYILISLDKTSDFTV